MAQQAGLELESRWASFAREPFTADSPIHVSVYRRPLSVTSAGARAAATK